MPKKSTKNTKVEEPFDIKNGDLNAININNINWTTREQYEIIFQRYNDKFIDISNRMKLLEDERAGIIIKLKALQAKFKETIKNNEKEETDDVDSEDSENKYDFVDDDEESEEEQAPKKVVKKSTKSKQSDTKTKTIKKSSSSPKDSPDTTKKSTKKSTKKPTKKN
jgi:hypothetical protein